MKSARMILRAGLLASVAVGTIVACTPQPPVGDSYVICDDTQNTVACPNETVPVTVDNSL